MPIIEIRLSPTFKRFLLSEQASGVLLLVCTVVSLILANSPLGHAYLHAWHVKVAGLPVEVWVNDGLMAVFFCSSGWNSNVSCTSASYPTFVMRCCPLWRRWAGSSCRRPFTSRSTMAPSPSRE